MPSRELGTPEDGQAALHGLDRRIIAATARAAHRSPEEAKQREHASGKKNRIRCKTRSCPCRTSGSFFLVVPCGVTITMTPGGNKHYRLSWTG
jgi:hypothetical protein